MPGITHSTLDIGFFPNHFALGIYLGPMKSLRITTVQAPLEWEAPEANRSAFAKWLAPLAGKTDLVILPEMWTTGFTMNAAAVAEPMDGPSVGWMRQQAARLDAVVTGSLVIEEGGRYYNRLIWMPPDGQLQYYDKRHLFTLAGEHRVYTAGTRRLVVEWRGWRICPLICYDLRFPVWSRNTEDFDLLVYVANWPEPRRRHWQQLLIARAIENQCFVAGVNRVGLDPNGHEYSGDTTIVDYRGEVEHHVEEVEDVFTLSLDREDMLHYRQRFNFLADRDRFTLEP